jgi:hypothetical protein
MREGVEERVESVSLTMPKATNLRADDPQALAMDCLCKMLKHLDGDFAVQVIRAGGVQCLLRASLVGNATQSRSARSALIMLGKKAPRSARRAGAVAS